MLPTFKGQFREFCRHFSKGFDYFFSIRVDLNIGKSIEKARHSKTQHFQEICKIRNGSFPMKFQEIQDSQSFNALQFLQVFNNIV